METVAKEFPAVRFTIIDAVVKLPNVRSVLFKEQEGVVKLNNGSGKRGGIDVWIPAQSLPRIQRLLVPKM